MTVPTNTRSSVVERPGPSSLEDVVASIDTYLRFADMVDRLASGETTVAGLTD